MKRQPKKLLLSELGKGPLTNLRGGDDVVVPPPPPPGGYLGSGN